MVYNVEVDQADLMKIQRKLKDMNKASSKIKNAINRTATQALKSIKAGRSKAYVIKAGTFNSGIKTQRASAAHLDATIKATGSPESITDTERYKVTAIQKGAGGYAATILKGQKTPIEGGGGSRKAFQVGLSWHSKDGRSGIHQDIAIRRGSSKLPIHTVMGPGTAKMVEKIWEGDRGGQGDLDKETQQRLKKEILAEIAKIM